MLPWVLFCTDTGEQRSSSAVVCSTRVWVRNVSIHVRDSTTRISPLADVTVWDSSSNNEVCTVSPAGLEAQRERGSSVYPHAPSPVLQRLGAVWAEFLSRA